jgi:hypothetical protein
MTMGDKDDSTKMKGVDKEECTRAEGLLNEIEQALNPHGIKVCRPNQMEFYPLCILI